MNINYWHNTFSPANCWQKILLAENPRVSQFRQTCPNSLNNAPMVTALVPTVKRHAVHATTVSTNSEVRQSLVPKCARVAKYVSEATTQKFVKRVSILLQNALNPQLKSRKRILIVSWPSFPQMSKQCFNIPCLKRELRFSCGLYKMYFSF